MRYEYTIYRPDDSENFAAIISTDEPLAHILVGHWLTLETPDFSTQRNHRFRIVGVECHLSQNKYRQPPSHIRIEVYLIEEERTPQ